MLLSLRYEDTIEGPNDVLDRDYKVYSFANTAVTRMLLKESPDPIMRRVYAESVLAKGGLFGVLELNEKFGRVAKGEKAALVLPEVVT